MGQSNLITICQDCGTKGPQGSKKAHIAGWRRGDKHTWLCPVHAEEAHQRWLEARYKRQEEREKRLKKSPLGAMLAMAFSRR